MSSPSHKKTRASKLTLLTADADVAKTSRLPVDSPYRSVQILDQRFEKLTSILTNTLTDTLTLKIRESEKRIVDIFEKKFDEYRKDLNEITKRIDALETVSAEVSVMAKEVTTIKSFTSDILELKNEINMLKMEVDKRDNASVSCDVRINGVPFLDNENLPEMFTHLCNTLKINVPEIKSIFRLRHTRSGTNNIDPTIIAKFGTSYQRNFVLKSISNFIRHNKEPLRLSLLGFDANNPFYVNENLTPLNYKTFLQALRYKRDRLLESVYTMRGKVKVKLPNSGDFCQVNTIDELNTLLERNDPKNLH